MEEVLGLAARWNCGQAGLDLNQRCRRHLAAAETLGAGGRAGRSSSRGDAPGVGLAASPPEAGAASAAGDVKGLRHLRPPRDARGRLEAAPERASQPRRPAPPGPLAPPARQLFGEPGV